MSEENSGAGVDPTAVSRALNMLRTGLDGRLASFFNSCVRCGLCAEVCHFYLSDGEDDSIPARKVEKISSVFRRYHTALGRYLPWLVAARPLTAEFLRELADSAFGRCTVCGRCALNCSVGLDPSAVIRFARVVLVAAGLVPKGIRANIDAALKTGNSMSITKEDTIETVEWLDEDLKLTLNDDAASIPIDRKGARILYALNPREVKFFPLSISAAAMIFHVAGEDWTLSSTNFDVTNYGFFAADDENGGKIADLLLRKAEELEVEELILAECGHGYNSNRWSSPEWQGGRPPIPVRNFLELLVEFYRDGRIKTDPSKNTERVTLHDPCNLVRYGGVVEEQRYILHRSASDFVEMIPNREHNFCCGGGGGLLAASEYKENRIRCGSVKADQIRATGAKILATPCHNCIDQLIELNLHYELGVEIKTIGEIVADALVFPDA